MMTARKRKKNTRQRGETTHGCGSMKKRRGAGNRGGRGNAGSGKKGDSKKPSYLKLKKFYGKFGFKSKSRVKDAVCINLGYIEQNLDVLVEKKLVDKKGDSIVVNLKSLKANKLLSSGRITKKYEITAEYASANSVRKVEALKGKVIILSQQKIAQEPTFEKEA